MTEIATTVGGVVTMLTTTATSVVGVLTDNPILLIGVGMGVVGGAVAFVKKLMKARG